ncbi:EpsG family protein [Viscerimonas tarda]
MNEPLFSYLYSVPYICLYVYFFALMFLEFRLINKNKDIAIVRYLCISVFLFFFGLRGFINTDWINYYPFFDRLPTIWGGGDMASTFDTEINGLGTMEPGFKLYSIIIKSIFPNYYCWQFISSLIDVFFLDYFFRKYSKYYALSFILFYIFGGLLIEINLMRNIKSIVLFMYSIKYVENRSMGKYMLINFIGTFIHFTSILYLPLYFVLNKKISNKVIWVVFIIGNLLYLSQAKFMTPALLLFTNLLGGRAGFLTEIYLESGLSTSYGVTIGYIERTASFILFFLFRKQILKNFDKANVFFNVYFIYTICFLYFSEFTILVERVPFLFIFVYWILYPAFFYCLKTIRYKFLFVSALFLYGCIKLLMGSSDITSKYHNILFGIESYEEKAAILKDTLKRVLEKD